VLRVGFKAVIQANEYYSFEAMLVSAKR